MKALKWLRVFPVLAAGLLLTSCLDSGGGDGDGSSGPRTVLVIGDSISGGVNYPGVPPWPSLLGQMKPEWTIVNRGVGGTKIASGRSRVGGLLAQSQPQTLVSFYGTNNAIQGDLAGFEGDLRAIIQAGKAAGAEVVVATIPRLVGARAIFNGRVAALNGIIRSVAPAEGARVVDLEKEFSGTGRETFPDGVHPNLDGQRIIAVAMREKI